MASLTDLAESAVLDHVLRTPTLSKPTNWYVGLLTAAPTEAGVYTEVSDVGTGYDRQVIAVADESWTAPVDLGGVSQISNLIEIQYDDPLSGWGTPSHWGLFDAVTGGNLWVYGPIGGELREILASDDPVSFSQGALNISYGLMTSLYLEAKVLNHLFRTDTFAKPANVYVGMHSEDPTRAGGVGEFSGVNYSRVALAVANASWTAPADAGTDKMVSNAVSILFPEPGSAWGPYTHISVSDSLAAGNLLYRGPFTVPRTINANDNPPIFLPGNLQVQIG